MKITISLSQSATASEMESTSATRLEGARARLLKLKGELSAARKNYRETKTIRAKNKMRTVQKNIDSTKQTIQSLRHREKRAAAKLKDKEKQKASGLSPVAYNKLKKAKERKANESAQKHHDFADNLHPDDAKEFWDMKKSDRNRMVKHREKNNTRYKDAFYDMHPSKFK